MVLDIGATKHVTNNVHWLHNLSECSVKVLAYNGDANASTATTQGELLNINIGTAIHVQQAKATLISYSQLLKDGYFATWSEDGSTCTMNKNQAEIKFIMNEKGLLTVREDDQVFHTKVGIKRAIETKMLHDALAHPSNQPNHEKDAHQW